MLSFYALKYRGLFPSSPPANVHTHAHGQTETNDASKERIQSGKVLKIAEG
jgi:hypothetical protein